MPRKNTSIDQLATLTTRQAQSEMAMMQRDLGKLRDSISGLTRGIKAPVPRGGSRTIKGSRSSLNPLIRAEASIFTKYAINHYLEDSGDDSSDGSSDDNSISGADYGFARSQAQIAGRALADLATGQRIR